MSFSKVSLKAHFKLNYVLSSFVSLGLLLGVSQGVEAQKIPTKSSIVPAFSDSVNGVMGSYFSLVRNNDEVQYFTNNLRGGPIPGIVLYSGFDLLNVEFTSVVVPNSIINDLVTDGKPDKNRLFTRPVVAYSKKDKKYYAVAHVSKGYPASDGIVYPAFLESKTSIPTGGWIYKGKFKGEVEKEFGYPKKKVSSGMAFIVNDNASNTLDHINPMNNKFVFYNDFTGLNLVYSQDGIDWYFYRDSIGRIVNLRPSLYSDDKGWIFSSAAKTPYGYFMYVSVNWTKSGPEGHRMLYSPNGLSWRIIGMPEQNNKKAPLEITVGGVRAKNVSISYDESTHWLNIYPTTGTGSNFYKKLVVIDPRRAVPNNYF